MVQHYAPTTSGALCGARSENTTNDKAAATCKSCQRWIGYYQRKAEQKNKGIGSR